ncbi:MAG: phasin family protein [Gammaproteobacteria bacterium]|nr:phasin family protein [Gammaproteobacteria bacterium]MCW5584061.1 phasin family protein [Gammaproteobacteria bacterium]
MQRQYTENWNKLYQCVTRPLSDLTELNMNTLQNWSKNTGHFEELTQVKKPEDFFLAQIKLANIGQLEMMSYVKKSSDIWIKAIEQINDICDDIARETTQKASEVIKSAHKSKE